MTWLLHSFQKTFAKFGDRRNLEQTFIVLSISFLKKSRLLKRCDAFLEVSIPEKPQGADSARTDEVDHGDVSKTHPGSQRPLKPNGFAGIVDELMN